MIKRFSKILMAAFVCVSGITASPQQVVSAAAIQEEMLPGKTISDGFLPDEMLSGEMPPEGSGQKESAGDIYTKAKTNAILPAPTTLETTKVSYKAVILSWSKVEGAAGYQIEYSKDGVDYTIAGKTGAEVLTYKCKKLQTGTAYKFRVCALDGEGKAGNYSSLSATPYLKRSKFTKLEVTQEGQVSLEWKKISGAEQYQLYRKKIDEEAYVRIASPAGPAYVDADIVMGEAYSYYVFAIRVIDGQVVQAKASAAKEISLGMPAAQFTECRALDHRSVQLTWEKADAVTGYYIYRSTKEDGTYKKIKTIKKNTTTVFTDTGVVPGKTFYYKICTYKTISGTDAILGDMSESLSAQPKMDAPKLTGLKANVGNRSISLVWEKAGDATGYRVYRSIYPDKKFSKITEIASGGLEGYEDRSVTPGGTYYYRVKALYKNDSYLGISKASNILQGSVLPSAPIGLMIEQTATDVLEISWQQSAGADSYNLYRAERGSGTYTCIAQGLSEDHYTDDGRKDDQTYFYQVSAVGTAGEGNRCRPVSYLVGGVALNTRTLKLCVGIVKPLEMSTFREGKAIWSSSDPEVATVDPEGHVTGVGYGTAQVTVTVAGKSATAVVSVTPGKRNGIDVSRWQEDVDWCRVKNSGVDFAFLRISNHYQEDYTFETKYQNATAVGMPLGVYCYSRAVTVEEAKEEARLVLQILNGRKLDLPIALDMEDAVHKSASMTKENLHQMILAFKQVIEDGGYQFLLYSYVSFLNGNLDNTRLGGIDLWVARYRSVKLGSGYTGTGNVKYWQYNSGQYSGSDHHVDGITDAAGNLVDVDVNVEY